MGLTPYICSSKPIYFNTRHDNSDRHDEIRSTLRTISQSALPKSCSPTRTEPRDLRRAPEAFHQNNDLLVLHQTTRHIDTSDRISEESSRLSMAPPASSKSFGVCLGQAPQIAADAFIRRTTEMQQLHNWLSTKSQADRQCTVSITSSWRYR